MPWKCRVDKALPPYIMLRGHWAMFWCQHPLKDVGRAAEWRGGPWKLFQRWRKCLTAGDLDVIYLVDQKKVEKWADENYENIYGRNALLRDSYLVKKSRKRTEAWKLKLNSNEKWSTNLPWGGRWFKALSGKQVKVLDCGPNLTREYSRHQMLLQTQMTDVYPEIFQSHIWICDRLEVWLDN